MSVQLIYNKKLSLKNAVNKVFFVNDKYKILSLKSFLTTKEYNFVSDLLKSKDHESKFLSFDISSKVKIILVPLKPNFKNSELENLGAKFYDVYKSSKIKNFLLNSDSSPKYKYNVIGYFLHGLKLKSYNFEKYKTKKNKNNLIFTVSGKKIPSTN